MKVIIVLAKRKITEINIPAISKIYNLNNIIPTKTHLTNSF